MNEKLTHFTIIALVSLLAFELSGGFYEWIVVASQWSAHPPASFAILQGEFGLPVESFWIPLHMIAQIVIVMSLILCWKNREARNWMWVIVGLYLLLRIPTFLYFIPELREFTNTPPSGPFSQELADRANMWVWLSIGRTTLIAIMYVISWKIHGVVQKVNRVD